jgi:CheY-like chemotaxis protein
MPKPPGIPPEVLRISMPKNRILCVDDHRDFCDLVCTILRDCELTFAQSKREGFRKAEGGLFDLYLLDYSLPDGTGLELARMIRQFDESTPILIITSPNFLTHREVSEAGAQGLLSKDELPHDLSSHVSRILNQAENNHSR